MKFFKTNMPMGRTDYYFLDQDGNKIELADAWIENRYIFGKHSCFDGGAVILNKEILEELIPIFQHWVKTGWLPEIEATMIRGCSDCKLDMESCGKCQSNIERNNGVFVYDDMTIDEMTQGDVEYQKRKKEELTNEI